MPVSQELIDRATELGPSIADGPAKKSWIIKGNYGTGKSALLQLLRQQLSNRNLRPIFLAPPKKAFDTGTFAALQLATGLRSHGQLNGEMGDIINPSVPWQQKVDLLVGCLREDNVVLCDDLERWTTPSFDPSFCPFTHRNVENLRQRLLTEQRCRVVFTTRPSGSPEENYWLPKYTGNASGISFGQFADVYHDLANRIGVPLQGVTWFEARLLTAWAVVTSPANVASEFPSWNDTWAIVGRFFTAVSKSDKWQGLGSLLSRLPHVRTAVSSELLGILGGGNFSEECKCVATDLLLTECDGQFSIPRFLRQHKWVKDSLISKELTELHKDLKNHFKIQVNAGGDAVELLEAEGFYHSATLGNQDDGFRLFFAEQLHALGKTLSFEKKDYAAAVIVYRKSVELAPDNDYGHHYLGYNLDVQAESAEETESAYMRAIKLNTDHPWYWSRWINFLITTGRIGEARSQWREAIAALDPIENMGIYHSLHLPVANLLAQRAQIDFAKQVLDDVDPPQLLKQDNRFQSLHDYCIALKEAQEADAVFPLKISPDNWWTTHPHLGLPTSFAGKALIRWVPARVDAIEGDVACLVSAHPPQDDSPAEYFKWTLSRQEFNDASTERFAGLTEDRFLEVGFYGADGLIRICLHPDEQWDNLTRLDPPDPLRYLRKAGWAQ